jgi:serine/threonine-protein kinase
MGVVWQARHIALNTKVAVKFLNSASAQRASTVKRFITEAQVTAQLKTRHAVQVFDFGVTSDGQPFLVMELLTASRSPIGSIARDTSRSPRR